MPQPIDDRRPAPRRGAPVRRPADEPQPRETEPRYEQRPPVSESDPKQSSRRKKFLLPIMIGLVVVGLAVAGWFAWSNLRGSSLAIDSDKYQAVFLTNGNTFFGKLETAGDNQMKLSQVFYPESAATTDADDQQMENPDANTTRLIPFKEHMYGPEDEMMFDRSQLVFFMNLKSDGQVSKLIKEYQDKN